MQILLFFPSLLLFLYILYRMVKDDYVFIRKGISLEQSFDIAFIIIWASLFMARFLYSLFHFYAGENIFIDFFSFEKGGFSLTGGVTGGALALYLIGRYRRVPLGRLSDFLCLSFLYTLPLLFLSDALIVKKSELLFVFLNAMIYFVLLLFFIQFLYPKIMNRTIKEGLLAILFLFFFSFISLMTSFLSSLKQMQQVLNLENGMLVILLLSSIVLFVKQERASHTRRTQGR